MSVGRRWCHRPPSDTVDHRTDLYALGCVAYEMLCGQTPFGVRPFHQLISAHLTETPEPITTRRAQVPAALASLVMQCLETDQEARPKDARTVVQALGCRCGARWAGAVQRDHTPHAQ